MPYISFKKVHGNEYAYLVEGHRENGKVKQRVLKYLGKFSRDNNIISEQIKQEFLNVDWDKQEAKIKEKYPDYTVEELEAKEEMKMLWKMSPLMQPNMAKRERDHWLEIMKLEGKYPDYSKLNYTHFHHLLRLGEDCTELWPMLVEIIYRDCIKTLDFSKIITWIKDGSLKILDRQEEGYELFSPAFNKIWKYERTKGKELKFKLVTAFGMACDECMNGSQVSIQFLDGNSVWYCTICDWEELIPAFTCSKRVDGELVLDSTKHNHDLYGKNIPCHPITRKHKKKKGYFENYEEWVEAGKLGLEKLNNGDDSDE